MIMIKKHLLVGLFILPLIGFSQAYGFVWFGFSWPDGVSTYWVNTRNSSGVPDADVIQSMNGAADAWAAVGASFNHCYQGTTTRSVVALNGFNDLFFSDETMSSVIAATYIWYNGPEYVEFDIKFFEGQFRFFGPYDTCAGSGNFYIWYIAMHELGHGLALGHPSDPNAIMYASARSCDPRTALEQDDIDGVNYIYGSGVPPGCF